MKTFKVNISGEAFGLTKCPTSKELLAVNKEMKELFSRKFGGDLVLVFETPDASTAESVKETESNVPKTWAQVASKTAEPIEHVDVDIVQESNKLHPAWYRSKLCSHGSDCFFKKDCTWNHDIPDGLCVDGIHCDNMDECTQIHPYDEINPRDWDTLELCYDGSDCTGDWCNRIHPSDDGWIKGFCYYGDGCRRDDCWFQHPTATVE